LVYAAVHSDRDVQAASIQHVPQPADLVDLTGEKRLAAEARIDGHHLDQVSGVQDLFQDGQ